MEHNPMTEPSLQSRDAFCLAEAYRIIDDDMYKILPLIDHQPPVKYIVDIGGNIGGFTIAASNAFPEAEIVVIEPDPELMDVIRYNTKSCQAKIHYIEKACIGHDATAVTFMRIIGGRAGSFVIQNEWQPDFSRCNTQKIKVPAITLPTVLAEYEFPRLDILKIDAEGVESGILLNLKQNDWMPKVHWIRGEWHGRHNWTVIQDALKETHVYALQPHSDNGEMIAHNIEDSDK